MAESPVKLNNDIEKHYYTYYTNAVLSKIHTSDIYTVEHYNKLITEWLSQITVLLSKSIEPQYILNPNLFSNNDTLDETSIHDEIESNKLNEWSEYIMSEEICADHEITFAKHIINEINTDYPLLGINNNINYSLANTLMSDHNYRTTIYNNMYNSLKDISDPQNQYDESVEQIGIRLYCDAVMAYSAANIWRDTCVEFIFELEICFSLLERIHNLKPSMTASNNTDIATLNDEIDTLNDEIDTLPGLYKNMINAKIEYIFYHLKHLCRAQFTAIPATPPIQTTGGRQSRRRVRCSRHYHYRYRLRTTRRLRKPRSRSHMKTHRRRNRQKLRD